MELLEYVLRNANLAGPSVTALPPSVFLDREKFPSGIGFDDAPLDDPDDIVSSEPVLCSNELDASDGSGGTTSAGASKPFFIVEDIEREPSEKRPFTLGADATRRRKRDADVLMDFGERGPWLDRDLGGPVRLMKDG